MSDSGSSAYRRRRRTDKESQQSRRKSSPQERKRRRSHSPSTSRSRSPARHDRHKRRPRSPLNERRERSDHRQNHGDYHGWSKHNEPPRNRRQDNSSHYGQDAQTKRRRRRSRSRSTSRSRSAEGADNGKTSTQPRHRRSRSRDAVRGSHRGDEEKQLIRARHERASSSSRDRHRRRRRRRHHHDDNHSHDKRRSLSRSPPETTRRARGPLPSQQEAFTTKNGSTNSAQAEKQKPNYSTSGKLAAETNTVRIGGESVVLKYHEPAEARKPPAGQAWRMYEFKGENAEPLSTTELGARSCWLFGRETAVVDFLIEHPSCSKQHAVLQFRFVEKRSEFGDRLGAVKPYLLDLESANGTLVNGEKIPDRRYIELKSGDSVGFGESTREYVVLLPPKEKVLAE